MIDGQSANRLGTFADRPTSCLSASGLRRRIVRSLRKQGFRFRSGVLVPPDIKDKSKLRVLHREAVKYNVTRSRRGLERREDRLLSYVASGEDVIPDRIRPRLVLVQPGSEDELLFRYARLHWSIPGVRRVR